MIRQIVQERDVTRDIESAFKEYRLVDEAIHSLEWTLARAPESGMHRTGRYWGYIQRGHRAYRIPQIAVMYTFTDDEVVIHAIAFRPEQ
jgi:hypothetical protein